MFDVFFRGGHGLEAWKRWKTSMVEKVAMVERGLKVELTASKFVQAFKKEIEKEIILPPLQDASSISRRIF